MIQIDYELPLGSKIEKTLAIGQKIENIMIEEIPEEHRERTFMRGGPNTSGFSRKVEDTNTAVVGARLISQDDRDVGVQYYANRIRTRIINEVPGIEKMDVKTSTGISDMMMGGEKPVTVKLAHKDFTYSRKYATALMEEMKKIPGLKDLSNDADSLKPEIEVKIDRSRASQVGLKTSMIAFAVREAFYGKTATIFRKDGDEYDVMVKYKKVDRANLEQLKEMELKTMYGTTVKLKDVAEVKEGLTSLAINRLNRERIITIGARLEDNIAIGKVTNQVEDAIKRAEIPDNIEIIYGGSIKQQQDTSGDLVLMLLLGIILVYLVMAAQFESFVDPFVIIFSIPFAITGVLLGLLISGNTLSVPAFLGMIILVGIVVNNAIVLVDYTKFILNRDKLSVEQALVTAGGHRLRPILMTATTTIGGMVPLAMMSGEGHEMFNPMGVAVVFGLAVSTLVTLILIPVMYASVDALLKKIKLR
jgi:HAE1 family hydrophobic/amphiphilic exporter-1